MRVVFLAAALWASVSLAQPPSAQKSVTATLLGQASSAPAAVEPAPAPAPAPSPSAAPAAPASDAPVANGPAAAPAQFSSGTSASVPQVGGQEELTHWGAMLDVGVPDGAGLSLLWRPVYFLRLNAGLTYNLLGVGVRGGVSLIPFYYWITPSLTLDVGHYFDADLSKYSDQLVSDPTGKAILGDALSKFSYDYGNLHLGLEIGSPHRFLFTLRGGVSYATTTIHNFQAAAQAATSDTNLTAADPTVKAVFPSLKLGFILYL